MKICEIQLKNVQCKKKKGKIFNDTCIYHNNFIEQDIKLKESRKQNEDERINQLKMKQTIQGWFFVKTM